MTREFECERDGVVIRGASDDELVANVERHIADAHPDLAGKVSREDLLAAAKEADELVLRLKRILPARPTAVYRALSDRGNSRSGGAPEASPLPASSSSPESAARTGSRCGPRTAISSTSRESSARSTLPPVWHTRFGGTPPIPTICRRRSRYRSRAGMVGPRSS